MNLLQPVLLEKLGTITTAPIQPEARLISKSENTDNQAKFIYALNYFIVLLALLYLSRLPGPG